MAINGIVNIRKEKGYTSHDVVAKMRGILKQKKIGHTGTLDPDATGVLPVCLGSATKLCDLITDKTKEYRTTFMLGMATDTQDISGSCLTKSEVRVNDDEVRSTILSYIGEIDQIPPMYSALKVNGKKLYELARAGVEIERKARKITIYDIVIEKIELPYITMLVSCSKGTYIRTLCHDIGIDLGCGAVMTDLIRTRVDKYSIDDAITLDELQKINESGELINHLNLVENFFDKYNRITPKIEFQRFLDNGNRLYLNQIQEEISPIDGENVRVYSIEENFRAIYRWNIINNCFEPYKMFN